MVYNISGGQPENLLDYISTLQEELVRAGVLPADYDFEGHRERVILMNDHIPTTKISEILREVFILGSEKNAVYAFRTEKYEWFLKKYPGLIDIVSHVHIASLLDISPMTLGRVRNSEK